MRVSMIGIILTVDLKEHESGVEHLMNMAIWYDLHMRLQKYEIIDTAAQRELKKKTAREKFYLDLS
jgi:hypothetical protein